MSQLQLLKGLVSRCAVLASLKSRHVGEAISGLPITHVVWGRLTLAVLEQSVVQVNAVT